MTCSKHRHPSSPLPLKLTAPFSLKGAVIKFRQSIIPIVTLLVMLMGLFCGAEAKTVEAGHATLRWTGTDVIDDLGNGDRVLSGTITWTIPVKYLPEGSGSPQIHTGKIAGY